MRKSKLPPRPTWTHLVTEALRTADDFMNLEQLRAATGGATNQISAALHHLQAARVVDSVQSYGALYWFLTGNDTRSKTIEMRTPEEQPRRRGRRAAPKE